MAPDDTVGNSDALPLWAMSDRPGGAYHWDGLQTSAREVFLSSALGDGATKDSVEVAHLDRMRAWLSTVMPPSFPGAIDRTKAAVGEIVFDRECADCHSPGGSRTWKVIPITEVQTDRNRLDMWTLQAVAAYNAFSAREPWAMKSFRKTDGYVARDLRGVWSTGPFLHNGSVPTLRELLEPPSSRTRTFIRGYDLLDELGVGFVSDARAEGKGFRVDVSVRGNSNEGHAYGTTLAPNDKDALVEFMKTL